jgi:hypothetical protein
MKGAINILSRSLEYTRAFLMLAYIFAESAATNRQLDDYGWRQPCQAPPSLSRLVALAPNA